MTFAALSTPSLDKAAELAIVLEEVVVCMFLEISRCRWVCIAFFDLAMDLVYGLVSVAAAVVLIGVVAIGAKRFDAVGSEDLKVGADHEVCVPWCA